MYFVKVLVLIVTCRIAVSSSGHKVLRHCHPETKHIRLNCPAGVISVDSAVYGVSRLPSDTAACGRDYTNLPPNCGTENATTYAKKICDGWSRCDTKINYRVDGLRDPCPEEDHKYTDVKYRCIGYGDNWLSTRQCDTDRRPSHVKCRVGVVSIKKAVYGRSELDACGRQYDSVYKCGSKDVTPTASQSCDGLPNCNVTINTSILGADPCEGKHKYTDIKYTCTEAEKNAPAPETTRKRVIRTTTKPPSNTSTIVVIVVATLLLLGMAVGCMVYYMKSSKKKRHGGDSSEGDAEDGTTVYTMGSSAASTSQASTSSRGFRSSMAAGSIRASPSSSFGNSRKSSRVGGSSRASRASVGSRKSAASIGSQGRKSFASRKHSAA